VSTKASGKPPGSVFHSPSTLRPQARSAQVAQPDVREDPREVVAPVVEVRLRAALVPEVARAFRELEQ